MIAIMLCAIIFVLAAAPAYAFVEWFDSRAYDVTALDIGEQTYLAVFDRYQDGRAAASDELGLYPTIEQSKEFFHIRGSITLINITDPEWPKYVSGAYGHRDGFEVPETVYDMAAAVIGGGTYLFAIGDGMLTLNVTDPENLSQVSRIPAEHLAEFSAWDSVSVHQMSGRTFAFAGSNILNVSNPSSPTVMSFTQGGPVKEVVELSGRDYVLIGDTHLGLGGGVLDMTDPRNPVRADFDHMVTADMWFETDYPVEFVVRTGPEAGVTKTAPMSDFTPDGLVEIEGGLYAVASIRTETGIWSGLINVTDPEKPVSMSQAIPTGPKSLTVSIGETVYNFPHPDFKWPGHSEWVFRPGHGVREPVARITYDPPDHWSPFTNTTDGIVPTETPYYGVELEGRMYVLIDSFYQSDIRPYEVRDITNAMRDMPYVFRTDLIPGRTVLLIEIDDNGTERYEFLPDIPLGGLWTPTPASYDLIAEQPQVEYISDRLNPGGHEFNYITKIGDGFYGLKQVGFGNIVLDIADPLDPVVVQAGMLHPPGSLRLDEILNPGATSEVVVRNAWPALSGHILPESAPVSHGSELLSHQAAWLVPAVYFDTSRKGGHIDISHDNNIFGNRLTIESSDAMLYEVSNPRNPTNIQPRGIHGGFFGLGLVSDAVITQISNKTYSVIVSEEHGGAVQIIDISDPQELKPVSAVFATNRIDRNAGGHNIAIAEIGDRIYAAVSTWGGHPLAIMDITNPEKPIKTGFVRHSQDGYLPMDNIQDMDVVHTRSGVYALLVSQSDHAIQVVDISNPASPKPVSSIDTMWQPHTIEATKIGDRSYAMVLGRGLTVTTGSNAPVAQMIDFTNPETPRITTSITQDTYIKRTVDVAITDIGNRVYALLTSVNPNGSVDHVQILDISSRGSATKVVGFTEGMSGLEPTGDGFYVGAVEIGGKSYMMVRSWSGGQLIDISNPASPVFGASIDIGSQPIAVKLGGGTYVVSSGTFVVNATDPQNPNFVMAALDNNAISCSPTGIIDFYTWVPGTRCD